MGIVKQYIKDDSTTYLFELSDLEEIKARSHAGGGVTNAECATMGEIGHNRAVVHASIM